MKILRANTDRKIKATVPGPFTMGKQAQDDFYSDEEAIAMDYAAAVNEEIKDLFAAGADIVQIDEPWMQQHPDKARQYGLKTLDRALEASPARSPCICALAMPPWCMTSRPAIRSWPSSKAPRRSRSRSRRRSPSSI